MDAPVYPPAAAFVQPANARYAFGVETMSLRDLEAMPAAWAIVLRHLPMFKGMVSSPMVGPIAGNMTVASFRTYVPGVITPEKLEAIDRDLRALPADQRRVAR